MRRATSRITSLTNAALDLAGAGVLRADAVSIRHWTSRPSSTSTQAIGLEDEPLALRACRRHPDMALCGHGALRASVQLGLPRRCVSFWRPSTELSAFTTPSAAVSSPGSPSHLTGRRDLSSRDRRLSRAHCPSPADRTRHRRPSSPPSSSSRIRRPPSSPPAHSAAVFAGALGSSDDVSAAEDVAVDADGRCGLRLRRRCEAERTWTDGKADARGELRGRRLNLDRASEQAVDTCSDTAVLRRKGRTRLARSTLTPRRDRPGDPHRRTARRAARSSPLRSEKSTRALRRLAGLGRLVRLGRASEAERDDQDAGRRDEDVVTAAHLRPLQRAPRRRRTRPALRKRSVAQRSSTPVPRPAPSAARTRLPARSVAGPVR